MDEIKEGENRPSEVFLALWCYRVNHERIDKEGFALAADAWWRIKSWEAADAPDLRIPAAPKEPERYPITPIPPEALEQAKAMNEAVQAAVDRAVAKVCPPEPESGPNRTPEDGGPAEAPAPAEQEAPEVADAEEAARKAAEAAKARSDAGAKGLITRKKNVLAALEELRDAGVKLQEIADADRRLTLLDVLQMMEHKPVSLPVLAALERAISTLKAKEGPPAEEDMT